MCDYAVFKRKNKETGAFKGEGREERLEGKLLKWCRNTAAAAAAAAALQAGEPIWKILQWLCVFVSVDGSAERKTEERKN